MKDGVYTNIDFEEYLKIDAFSKSMVDSTLKSGLHLKHYMDNPKTGDRLDVGSLVDCLLLEPELFEDQYRVLPLTSEDAKGNEKPFSMQLKAAKELVAKIYAEGHTPIKKDVLDVCKLVVERIKSHPLASKWLDGSVSQVTVVWTDPDTGVRCKARPDALKADHLIDLKTTECALPNTFSRIAFNFGYHIQSAMYHDGISFVKNGKYPEEWDMPCSIICAEVAEPYDVVCYTFDQEESLFAGRVQYREALRRYADIKEAGEYKGYSDYNEELKIPQWAISKINYDGESVL